LRRARADAEHAGWRLDRFLAAAVPDLSRSRLQALLADGAVSRAQETIKDGNTRVKPGETYEIAVPEPAPAVPRGQAIPLNVVYEDGDLIVIDKPAGLVVHPAAGNPDGTLVNALIAHCGESLAGVGGVAGEEVNSTRVGDERPGAVDEFGDQLADREPQGGAEAGGDGGAAPARPPEQTDNRQHRDEQRLGGIHVEEQRILNRVVAEEVVVQRVQQGPIHAPKAVTTCLHTSACCGLGGARG